MFESFVIALILVTTVLLAIGNVIRDASQDTKDSIDIVENVVTALFATEALIKITALGFISTYDTLVTTHSLNFGLCGLGEHFEQLRRQQEKDRSAFSSPQIMC